MNSSYNTQGPSHYSINGTFFDVKTSGCYSEIRSDIIVSENKTIRLWGQIINCNGQPIPYALLKLVKVIKTCHGVEYKGIAHTTSDCNGFYQFDICKTPNECYRVLVSKADMGPEYVMPTSHGYCNQPYRCMHSEKCQTTEPSCSHSCPPPHHQSYECSTCSPYENDSNNEWKNPEDFISYNGPSNFTSYQQPNMCC